MQPIAGGPADNAAGKQVEDNREIQPAFPGPDVRDVDAPFLIGSLGLEHLAEQVRCHGPGELAVGGALEPTLLAGDKAVLTHQPGRAPATDRMPIILKFARHARTAHR